MPRRVILWGYGTEYQKIKDRLHAFHDSGKLRILGITATDPPKQAMLDGWKVLRPEVIEALDHDLILICNVPHYKEIAQYILRTLHVDRRRLMPSWVIENAQSIEEYQTLVENPISILSNNCWGGVLSSGLGLEHRSPTKNCWFLDPDYFKLLKDPEHYFFECDPVFRGWMPGGDERQTRYPVLSLDDVLIFCNHDTDPDTAIQNWLRRREKLELDRVFVSYSPDSPEKELAFSRLDRYPNKLCIVPWEPQCACSVKAELAPEDKQWMNTVIRTAAPLSCLRYFSPLRLLLAGEHY